jgi:hypothetical protein
MPGPTSSAALRLLCILVFAAFACSAQETKHWNLPRFTADPKAIQDAVSTVTIKKGTEVVVLYEEKSFTFDSDGKSVQTLYRVYKILSQNGVEGWDSSSVEWEPWHEVKPSLNARVIAPDGVSHSLDQKSITDSPASDGGDDTYGDRRIVRAPLPAVGPGSIIEEEEIVKESAPLYAEGTVEHCGFGKGVPVQETRLILDYPAALPVQYHVQLLPDLKQERSEQNGRVRIEFIQGQWNQLRQQTATCWLIPR